jgi:TRAP-type mannitol/chloroaromatic compound transport system permease small subunit
MIPVLAAIDRLGRLAARAGMAVIVALLAVLLLEVFARYGLGRPTVWGGDLATMLNGSIFLLGAAATLRQGGHIRIDALSDRLPERIQNLIGALAYLLLMAPLLTLLAYVAAQDTGDAFASGEVDLASAWQVPVWPMRALIALCLGLLLLQVVAEGLRHLAHLRRGGLPASAGGGGNG